MAPWIGIRQVLVTKEYNQVEGIDHVESFSPMAKAVIVRIFLTVASGHSRPIHQVDINNAFLHGYLDEDITCAHLMVTLYSVAFGQGTMEAGPAPLIRVCPVPS
ncbi:UNVERIFIED_CONTAM: hypothetical protein Scaly_2247100 [Sesamum calycinum]|uniref:Reverse transcriptase Ty1/copia-type domain-containing protein n=1 Tax=Sesamum calycinum TaxID=2727403 RepID=A0AAW2M9K6_9LAMI